MHNALVRSDGEVLPQPAALCPAPPPVPPVVEVNPAWRKLTRTGGAALTGAGAVALGVAAGLSPRLRPWAPGGEPCVPGSRDYGDCISALATEGPKRVAISDALFWAGGVSLGLGAGALVTWVATREATTVEVTARW